jgi:hypothetical protein
MDFSTRFRIGFGHQLPIKSQMSLDHRQGVILLLGVVTHFPKVVHRLNYFAQVNIAHHFGDRGAIQLMPTLVHRNYVANTDVNDLFALGVAGRLRLTSRFALIGEYYYAFNGTQFRQEGFTNSGAIALEWFTFGHNFTIANTDSAIVLLQVNIMCSLYRAADQHSSIVLYQDWMWIGPRARANHADPKPTPRPNPQLVVHVLFIFS